MVYIESGVDVAFGALPVVALGVWVAGEVEVGLKF